MLWADWSSQERFSEPVKYCLNPRCVRVMWKQGQMADAAWYVGVARTLERYSKKTQREMA